MEYAFLLDMSRCIGCEACVVACKTGNELTIGTQYIKLNEKTSGVFPDLTGGFQNQRCYHCLDAACVSVCPTGALFKEDGPVLPKPSDTTPVTGSSPKHISGLT